MSIAALAFGAMLILASAAAAHEQREVAEYTLVAGWVNEPAYINEPNAIDFRVSRTSDESPVEGLEQTVDVQVTSGEETIDVDLRPRFGEPGAYDGRLFPTREGEYTFHFTGEIEGLQLDETFTSGPDTFGSIEAPPAFPEDLPQAQQLEDRIVSLEDRGSGSSDGTARMIGIVGIVIGSLGLVAGGMGLTHRSG